jgi:hypothetical protein
VTATIREGVVLRLDHFHPDMVEEVRVMAEIGEEPVLLITRRKAAPSLLTRLIEYLPGARA